MSEDVVAELGRWLDDNATAITITSWAMIKRARDEVVALRAVLDIQKRLPDKIAVAVRAEALEEAAGLCELSAEIMQPDEQRLSDAIAAVKSCAAAIRALKEKH